MNGIVTVPAPLVADLRRGLRCALGNAAAGIAEATELPARAQCSGLYAQHRQQLEDAFAALDLVGFCEPTAPRAVHLDLRVHRRALQAALDEALLVAEDDLAERLAPAAPRDLAHPGAQRRAEDVRALRQYSARIAELVEQLEQEGLTREA
jgi:hypothetical protein